VLEQGGSSTGIAAAREGLAALRSYAWLIAILVVVGLVVGYLASAPSGEVKYRAWITGEALGANPTVTDIGISTPQGPQAADFLGDGIVARVQAATGESYDGVIEHLDLEQPPNGGPNPPIALIAQADSDPDARALLDAWLRSIRAARLHYVQGVLRRGEMGLRKSLEKAVNRNQPATERAIVELLARMQALRATLVVDYAVTARPKPFDEPAALRARGTLTGAAVGGIVGLALALLLPLLGGRLRTAEGASAAVGVELLADLRSSQEIPTAEHARERLRSIGEGSLPSELLLLPCGGVPADAAEKASRAVGGEIAIRTVGSIGEKGLLEALNAAPAWAVLASPGSVSRAEAAALRTELAGTGTAPVGLFVV
jgi:hypothetical protein